MFHFDVLLLYMEEPQMRIEVVVPGVQLFNILCSILGLRQVVRSENRETGESWRLEQQEKIKEKYDGNPDCAGGSSCLMSRHVKSYFATNMF